MISPARRRFACYRQRRGRLGMHNPGCRRTDRHFDFPPGLAPTKRTGAVLSDSFGAYAVNFTAIFR